MTLRNYNRLLIRHINRYISSSSSSLSILSALSSSVNQQKRCIQSPASKNDIFHFPVAIVGGGPVGLLLSLLLSQYNVKHILFEKRYNLTSFHSTFIVII